MSTHRILVLYVDGQEVYHTLDTHRIAHKIIMLTKEKPQFIQVEERRTK